MLLAVVLAFLALSLFGLIEGQDTVRGFGAPRLGVQVTPTATPTCPPTWEVIPSENVGNYNNFLSGVDILSVDDIWAVGNYMDENRLSQKTTAHWNGKQWSIIPSPSAGSYSSLRGVSAVSSNDVWAVGNQQSGALTMHWNGTKWSIVPNQTFDFLQAVTAVAADDVWAAGTMILHWNGTAWEQVPHPGTGTLYGLAAVSHNDIWAVGSANGALILHWDGTQWSEVPSPSPANVRLYSVAAISTNDVWAVGSSTVGSRNFTHTLHWNGSQWSVVPSPNFGTEGSALWGVSAFSTNNVWAVGEYPDNGRSRTLTMHWDGTAWSIVPSPSPASAANFLRGVAADDLGNFWAVGTYSPLPSARTLVLRYPNSCLTGSPTPSPTRTGTPATLTPSRSPTFTTTPSPTRTITPTHTPAPCGNYLYTATMGATIVPGTVDIGNHCDDCTTAISLPFSYNLYGVPFETANVSSNGNLQLLSDTSAFANACLPTPVFSYTIMVGWDDLRTDSTHCWGGRPCGIYTSVSGSAPNRIFNIEWLANCYTECMWNFEIRLFEGQDRFDLIYGYMDRPFYSATIGVQRDQGHFTQFLCNTFGDPIGSQITFTYSPCTTGTPTSTRTPTRSPTYTGTPPATSTITPTDTSTAVSTGTTTTTPSTTPTPCLMLFSDVYPGDYFYEAVRFLYCVGVISGYSDGTFRPYNNTTRGQLTKIVVLAFGFELYAPPTPTFTDVPTTDPFYEYIETAAFNQLVSGYSDGTFRPYNNVTRGQLCKIVVVAAGWPLVNPPTPTFTDVPPEDPFYSYIETAYEYGIISGYSDRTFRPGNNATRGQISKIVYEAVIAR